MSSGKTQTSSQKIASIKRFVNRSGGEHDKDNCGDSIGTAPTLLGREIPSFVSVRIESSSPMSKDHGVWWISSLGSQQAINFLLCRRLDSSKLIVSEYAVVQAQWPNDRSGRSPRLP